LGVSIGEEASVLNGGENSAVARVHARQLRWRNALHPFHRRDSNLTLFPPDQIRLVDFLNGNEVLGTVRRLLREDAKMLIDRVWWTELESTITDATDQPDRHWEWRRIVSAYQNKPYFRTVCVTTDDGRLQGAMAYRVDTKSMLEPGQRAVHVDRLATAPWNRIDLVGRPLFRRVGTGLLEYAIAQSHLLGFSGRINLIAVANEGFYLSRGFVATDIMHEDGPVFELPASVATQILKNRGIKDD
jgi:hypothetical protein